MNNQVAWDSEYYLAIAVGGYDDSISPQLPITDPAGLRFGQSLSLSYAFFPFYPLMIRLFAVPLQVLGLTPIAAAALAGVIVSALGALMGMLALYDLARGLLGQEEALRAAFYLIIFPTAFFLMQVYTEGLFVGLAFACLCNAETESLAGRGASGRRRHYDTRGWCGATATVLPAAVLTAVAAEAVRWLFALALPLLHLPTSHGPFHVSVSFLALAYVEAFVLLGGAYLAAEATGERATRPPDGLDPGG